MGHLSSGRYYRFVCLLIVLGAGPTASPIGLAAELEEPLTLPAEKADGKPEAAASSSTTDDTMEPFDWRDDLYGPMVVDGEAGVTQTNLACPGCRAANGHCRQCRLPADRGPAFYLAGIIGPSFGTFTNETLPAVAESLFTAGGAVGVDLNPAAAGWRFDFEARYRDPLGETATLGGLPVSVRAEQLWSTLVNAYRDLELADTLDLYLTAGIGAGGYQSSYAGGSAIFNVDVAGNRGLTGFAWQAGTGIAWEVTERVTFDVGYRFFEVAGGTTTVTATQSGTVLSTIDIASAFSASEVLFSLRIYEPFRSWR
jgi:opacity protein-like surface antigen